MGALAVHARGRTNTATAREAFLARFEREVDPDGLLDIAERRRRAEYALRLHMTRLSRSRQHKRSQRAIAAQLPTAA
jgi:hypothetical protein